MNCIIPLLLGILQTPSSAEAESQSENVLIILADDLGVTELESFGIGSDYALTPVLDSLALGGMRFTNAWSNPICSPTRAAILTGRFSFRTGIGTVVDAVNSPLQC